MHNLERAGREEKKFEDDSNRNEPESMSQVGHMAEIMEWQRNYKATLEMSQMPEIPQGEIITTDQQIKRSGILNPEYSLLGKQGEMGKKKQEDELPWRRDVREQECSTAATSQVSTVTSRNAGVGLSLDGTQDGLIIEFGKNQQHQNTGGLMGCVSEVPHSSQKSTEDSTGTDEGKNSPLKKQ